jgi:hypothetical protein
MLRLDATAACPHHTARPLAAAQEPEVEPAQAPVAEPEEAPAAEVEPVDELEVNLPQHMRVVINNKIQAEVRKMQAQMEAAFQERETRLLEKVATLTAPRPATKGAKK